jgi:hypothetical protein
MCLGAEVTALVCEAAMDHLKAPPCRVTMPDVAGIPVSDPMEDVLLPTPATIAAAVRTLVRGSGRRAGGPQFDAATPEAASMVQVCLGEAHLDGLLPAVVSACRAFPQCNAEFTWDGIRFHPEVRLDLDLGPHAPARGDGTFTLVDYGAGSSLLGVPAVRPGQTAALRVGAVCAGGRPPRRRRRRRRPLPGTRSRAGRRWALTSGWTSRRPTG